MPTASSAPGSRTAPTTLWSSKARPLTPGELGCYSSHYHAWLVLLDSRAAQMIVLENDTVVDWTFLEKLATLDFSALGVSYLRLFGKRPCAFRLHGEVIEPRRYLVEYAPYVHGTRGTSSPGPELGGSCAIAAGYGGLWT